MCVCIYIYIYITELVILFLITLANKGLEIMFAHSLRLDGEVQSIFHITFIHVLTISFGISGRT